MINIEQLAPKYFIQCMDIMANFYDKKIRPNFPNPIDQLIHIYNLEESYVEHPHTKVWQPVSEILYDLKSDAERVSWLKTLNFLNKTNTLTLFYKSDTVAA